MKSRWKKRGRNILKSLSIMKTFRKASFLSSYGDNFMTPGFLKTEPNKLSMCCSACKILGAIQGTPQVGDGPFSQRASGADGENSYKRKTLEQSTLNGVSLGLKNRGEEPQVGCLLSRDPGRKQPHRSRALENRRVGAGSRRPQEEGMETGICLRTCGTWGTNLTFVTEAPAGAAAAMY